MLLMASAGLGAPAIAKHYPDSAVWRVLGYQTDHVVWAGCAFWDLIQPAFLFMVGIALPWSVANRQARGQGFGRMFVHALWRSVLLVVIAVVLTSNWSRQTEWVFTNVLAQIGLGYPILFALAFTSPRTQWIAAFGILFAYWGAFALHPLPAVDFDWTTVGVPEDWSHLGGFAAHWEKNTNLAATFDVWFLNLFPRAEPFVFQSGGYQTLNFLPSLATMIFGLCAGRLLKGGLPLRGKLARLVLGGLAAILLGWLIARMGLCPLVKRIWTPSWAIFSSGWVALMLAGFVGVIDGLGWKRWAFPLVVVGMNPITMYCLWQLGGGFIKEQIRIHFGADVFASLGEIWVPALDRGSVLLVLWLVLWGMYRRKIFLRV